MICRIYFTPNKYQSARLHANSNTIYAFFKYLKPFFTQTLPSEIRGSYVT